jgi:hypothetical protein
MVLRTHHTKPYPKIDAVDAYLLMGIIYKYELDWTRVFVGFSNRRSMINEV